MKRGCREKDVLWGDLQISEGLAKKNKQEQLKR
jgi:hypothetical protein